MYRKDVNARSPLRILEQSIHGGLGKGNLGVVMARAGVGKTACLVQIGLDDLMREKDVLHVALGQTLEHVQAWYDALFDDLASRTHLDDREAVRASVVEHRVIQTYGEKSFLPEQLEKVLALFEKHLSFAPQAILIDGYDWSGPVPRTAAEIGAFKSCAKRLGAELWMTAQTHREVTGKHPTRVTPPCEAYADLIDVAIFLEPHGAHVSVRLLKDHEDAVPPDTHLVLHCDTLGLATDDVGRGAPKLPASAFTLLSGGASGSEAEFGECAERHGVQEINFSFDGRGVARTRGLVELNEAELQSGDVSSQYLAACMHRNYSMTPLLKKVIQSIWHQVNTAGEVFVVGTLLPDNTVKGGTGWAAELARHWGKPVHVYDQERRGWFRWRDSAWSPEPDPRITHTRFTGTGTRFLSDDGRRAIRALFERSFGGR